MLHRCVELAAQVEASPVPAHHRIRSDRPSLFDSGSLMLHALTKAASRTASTSATRLLLRSITTFSSIISCSTLAPTLLVNLLMTDLVYPLSLGLIRQSLLRRLSMSRILVSSLRLRIPFILMMINDLSMPSGFLGGPPGPDEW